MLRWIKNAEKPRGGSNEIRTSLTLFGVWVVLLLLCIYLLNTTMKAATDAANDQSATVTLYQIRNSMEEMFKETDSISGNLVMQRDWNRKVEEWARDGKNSDELIDFLKKSAQNYSFIRDIYLFSADGKRPMISSSKDITQKDLEALMDDRTLDAFHNITDLTKFSMLQLKTADTEKYILMEQMACFCPLISRTDARTIAGLLFVYDKNAFRVRAGMESLGTSQELYVMDNQDNPVFYSKRDLMPENLRYNSLVNGRNKPFAVSAKGEKIRLYAYQSTFGYFKYILACKPKAVFAVFPEKSVVTLIFLGVLLGGLILVGFLFLLYQLLAIQKTIQVIQNESNQAFTKAPFFKANMLGKMVFQIVMEKQSLSVLLHKNKEEIRTVHMMQLLNGGRQYSKNDTDLANMNIRFVYEDFAVTAFKIQDMERLQTGSKGTLEQEKTLLRFVVDNIFRDFFNCNTVLYRDMVLCVLDFDCKKEKITESYMTAKATVVVNVCEKELNVPLLAGVSSIIHSVKDIPKAYSQSLYALEQVSMNTAGPVLAYEQTEKIEKSQTGYSAIIEKQYHLLNSCKVWNGLEVRQLFEQIFGIIQHTDGLSLESAKGQVVDIVKAMISALQQVNGDILDDSLKRKKLPEIMQRSATIAMLRENVELFIQTVEDCLEQKRNLDKQDLIARVEQVLSENYADVNLSVTFIADVLGVHFRTLSNLYKQKTGYGLLERIHGYRVDIAKKLLLETEKSVSTISQETGYENVNTFIRVFKKYTGVTPGRFRETH